MLIMHKAQPNVLKYEQTWHQEKYIILLLNSGQRTV